MAPLGRRHAPGSAIVIELKEAQPGTVLRASQPPKRGGERGSLFYAILSGLHPTLPLAELRGILEALGHRYQLVETHDLLAVFRCSCGSTVGAAWRAGLVQETGRIVAVSEAEEKSIAETVLASDLCGSLAPGDRVKITLTRLRGYAHSRVGPGLPRRLAAALEKELRGCGATVGVRGANRTLNIIVTEGLTVIGLVEDRKPDSILETHRPQRRPFFHPGSLDPRLARLFVNLARARPPGPYLDPFCGTGGFPLEAQTLGIPSLCGELAAKLAHGARVNLESYPGHEHLLAVAQWDATRLPLRDESVQSIGTDPPYGRSISLRGKELHELLQGFLAEAARVLKRGGYLAYAAPHWAAGEAAELTREAGLEVLEIHYQKLHRSLTRAIMVARQPR